MNIVERNRRRDRLAKEFVGCFELAHVGEGLKADNEIATRMGMAVLERAKSMGDEGFVEEMLKWADGILRRECPEEQELRP
jgi:hypothetical protein